MDSSVDPGLPNTVLIPKSRITRMKASLTVGRAVSWLVVDRLSGNLDFFM
jgi:hypothetical protein